MNLHKRKLSEGHFWVLSAGQKHWLMRNLLTSFVALTLLGCSTVDYGAVAFVQASGFQPLPMQTRRNLSSAQSCLSSQFFHSPESRLIEQAFEKALGSANSLTYARIIGIENIDGRYYCITVEGVPE